MNSTLRVSSRILPRSALSLGCLCACHLVWSTFPNALSLTSLSRQQLLPGPDCETPSAFLTACTWRLFSRARPSWRLAACKGYRQTALTQGRQHVVHGHIRTEVPNAYHHFVEPVDEGSQRLSFLLMDANQAIKVIWCKRLVANCISNLDINVAQLSVELGGSLVNQLRALPFRDVGNTQQMTASSAVYKLMCVVYASMCSSGSVVLS